MPWLRDISYSEDACIAAVCDYYDFLTKMYMDDSAVIYPPDGSWPTITAENLKELGKTDNVFSLLRRLPYINVSASAEGAPFCFFADWQLTSQGGVNYKITSEGFECYENVPSSVVSLTKGGRYNPIILLDTELGVVYWYECPGELQVNSSKEQVLDDAYEYAEENEADWRSEGACWSIVDFFEVLKHQFQQLYFVPMSTRTVQDIYPFHGPNTEMLAMVQDIYRQHGWPNLERYCKQECLKDISRTMEERYPDYIII